MIVGRAVFRLDKAFFLYPVGSSELPNIYEDDLQRGFQVKHTDQTTVIAERKAAQESSSPLLKHRWWRKSADQYCLQPAWQRSMSFN